MAQRYDSIREELDEVGISLSGGILNFSEGEIEVLTILAKHKHKHENDDNPLSSSYISSAKLITQSKLEPKYVSRSLKSLAEYKFIHTTGPTGGEVHAITEGGLAALNKIMAEMETLTKVKRDLINRPSGRR